MKHGLALGGCGVFLPALPAVEALGIDNGLTMAAGGMIVTLLWLLQRDSEERELRSCNLGQIFESK